MDNQKKYDLERNRRWKMAEGGEPMAIQAACRMLSGVFGTECAAAL